MIFNNFPLSLEGEAPKVIFCPKSLVFTVENYSSQIYVSWKEPEFVDNLGITEIRSINVSITYS
jgi:HYR domain